MKTDGISNTFRTLKDRLVLSLNRHSIKTVLLAGFAVVIFLGLTAALLTEWTIRIATRSMDNFIKVDYKISELCLMSATAMTNARRNEKDFLLSFREYGFQEAKSRYITRVLTNLMDVKEFMKQIRLLTGDPEVIRRTQEVDQAVDAYQARLFSMVEKYGALGFFNAGLEGAMRSKGREIESLVNHPQSDRLVADYLTMRRREKDFIMRNLDENAVAFKKAAKRFESDLAASGYAAERKKKINNLTREYRALFEHYVRMSEEIRGMKKGLLRAVQTVEPILEQLYLGSVAKVTAVHERMTKTQRALALAKTVAGLLALLFSLGIALAVSRIISNSVAEREQSQSRIRYLAYYDGLTSLPNRTFFKELLSNALTNAQRYKTTLAILYLDLDDFKRINDTLGHDVGDMLLKAVSERIAGSVRRSDNIARSTEEQTVVSRLGGDEFIILLHHVSKIPDVSNVARRILNEISTPFDLQGHEVVVGASLGICVYPSSGENADDLLKNADAAMYHAKRQGKNNYRFYSQELNAKAIELMNLERDLRRAIEQEDILVYYQPKIQASRGKTVGMEALVRWKHKERGIIPPAEFIPLAEDTGLIVPLGERVLLVACTQANAWRTNGFEDINISVNLSVRQFDQKNLVEVIEQTLRTAGLPPQNLELEITESMVMQRPEEAIAVLQKLKDVGVRISIDDFGTGYSSLNYLRRLPVDSLKIDRSFVMNAAANPSDAAIIRGIIGLAHSLKLNVIAEGVETEEQFAFLREAGCDEVQGYLFSKPLPAEEFSRLLIRQNI